MWASGHGFFSVAPVRNTIALGKEELAARYSK